MMNMYEAYVDNIRQILVMGDEGVTEDGEGVITKPIPHTARFDPRLKTAVPPGLGKMALAMYCDQIMDPDKGEFDYTYGNRLRQYFGIDQFKEVSKLLLERPDTRRAIMTTNDPKRDMKMKNKPCLQFVQVYQDPHNEDFHKMFVLFRSHDMLSGWYANMVGMRHLARELGEESGIEISEIICTSVIPHIYYKRDIEQLREVCQEAGLKCPF